MPQGLRLNERVYIERERFLFLSLAFLLLTCFANLSISTRVFLSMRAVKRRFHPEARGKCNNETFMKTEARSHLSPPMGTISRVYSDDSPAAGLSSLYFSLTLCRALCLSGTLRKIGYLCLCLAFSHSQPLSILPFSFLSLRLSPSLPLSSSVGLLEGDLP